MAARLDQRVGRHIFGADVAGYHDARPGYPDELYALIAERVPVPRAIGEIGPGTGLATAALAAWSPARFVAFEPDPMLAAHLRGAFATLDVIEDDFCAADVAPGFDLIASASSFHWLDAEAALAKARTLLKPGGTLAIWWNVYRQPGIGDPFAEAVLPLLDGIELPPSESVGGHYSLDTALHIGRFEAAGFERIEHRVFRRERPLTAVAARALYASFSLVRQLAPDRRAALLDAIASVVRDRFGGVAPSVVLSPIYLATAPSLASSREASVAESGK